MPCLAMLNAANVSVGGVSRNSIFPLNYILGAGPPNTMLKAVSVIKDTGYPFGLPNSMGKSPRTDILNSICAVSPKHVGCVQCALWAERVMRCQSLSVDKQACVLVSTLLSVAGVLPERQRG
jgi:hypothetical protein